LGGGDVAATDFGLSTANPAVIKPRT